LKLLRTLPLWLLLALAPNAWAHADSSVNSDDLLRTGQADEALRALNAEVQSSPNNAAAYNQLARLYYQLEHWDSALKMAEKSVALEPRNSMFHQWLGRAAGRKAEASNPFTAFALARRVHAEFERAVALDGDNISARADLAEYYIEAPSFLGGDKNKARLQADAVAAHDPALASYIRARVEEKQGTGRAEQQYQKAIADSGDSARYWIELAYYYRRAGRLQDMENAINRSLTAARHEGMPQYDGAFILLRTGRNFPQAVRMLHDYVTSENVSEDGPAFQARYLLGQLLEKQGERHSAADEYRASLALASQFRPSRDALARVSR
jgi:tetratricopeptide (TPR) repeat protein